jgi:hypothetical protein
MEFSVLPAVAAAPLPVFAQGIECLGGPALLALAPPVLPLLLLALPLVLPGLVVQPALALRR